nr:MAG TPA: putative tail-component [Caudoviricetes sp.]
MIEGKLNIAFDKIKERYIKAATQKFIEVGEHCITEARDNGSYTDRTGNLRSSVGYVVLLDGVVQSQGNINKHNQEQIEKIKVKYPKGLVLIVVAGKNYAAYVEAKGYNVLSSAELMAENILKQLYGS